MAFSFPGTNRVTTLRGILTRSLAYSRTYNTRNLEHYWYPCWNHTLVDLTADNSRLLVAPQFPLYISPHADIDDQQETNQDGDEEVDDSPRGEGEGGDEGPWIEGAASLGTTPQVGAQPQADSEELMADLSFSTAATTPDAKAVARVTDFAILHISPQQSTALPRRYEGYRVDRLTVPLILEEKRFPSRSLAGDAFTDKLKTRVREAQEAAVFQVALLFRKFPAMQSVMVIAAAGPYWTNTTFRRSPTGRLSAEEFQKAMRIDDFAEIYRTVDHRRWSKALRLNTSESTHRFRAIYNNLAKLG
ncbi:hypothetical protein LshimejAT787_0202760 [Lyophyllum shimeji]|uniref:Uncharacterized protein n=1 Tax=Lyophyllum shimeji TaxID=47721 RepID=A0A9P3PFV8_LYOSH|nr:hypothetical protein LshimejAT787_0202760 [Lyophyllum shimeji]